MSRIARSTPLTDRGAALELSRLQDELKRRLREDEPLEPPFAEGETALAWRISRASLLNDRPALRATIAEVLQSDDPDLRFLADWACFWTFGAGWHSLLPLLSPRLASWRDDQQWMLNRRRRASMERRTATGDVPLLVAPGPLRAEIEINGIAGTIILDTGAPSSVLAPEFARRAGLVAEDVTRDAYDGAGRRGTLAAMRAATVRLGNWRGENLPFDTLTISAPLGVDGIVAPFDLFGHAAMTFDLARTRLLIGAPPAAAAIARPLIWSEGVAYLRVVLGGAPALALLDTGAGATVLTEETATRAGLLRAVRQFESPTALGTVNVTALGESTIALPGLPALRHPFYAKALTPPRPRPLPRLTDAYLGRTWFAHHGVHVPAERRHLLIWPHEGGAP